IYAVESDLGASKPNIWLTNLTIAFNAASNGGGMYFGNVLMHVRNNIIAETLSGGDCVQGAGSSITQHGENLDTDNSCPTFSIMASPMLGLLTDNGGSTLTHALNLGSPAIDVVSNCTEMPIGSPLTEDQRGVSRPQPTGGICDLGAFEFELQQASLRLSPEPSEDLTAMATTTVTRAVPELAPFVEAITPANCRSGPGTVYDVVSALDEGQTASAIGSNAANTWTLVEISETIDPCWVSNSTVELNIDPARLEVFQDPPTPTATSRPPTATFTPTSQPPTATFTP
ncbi:MAG: hypothetical protein GTO14_15810, partial [Anaerolineales bacterium]|nr:hypothetical protein [Anaerolineales bacterium]